MVGGRGSALVAQTHTAGYGGALSGAGRMWGMDWKNHFRRPLSLSDQMVIAQVLVGIVVALFLIAFGIFCYFFGWP
jgi:hypothetical protein